MNAHPRAEIGGDPTNLRKDELEIDVGNEIAEGNATEIDVVGRRGIHDAVEAPLEAVARRLIELRMKVRESQEQPHPRRDAPVVDAQPGRGRPDELRCADEAGIDLNAGKAEVVVGELAQDTLRGQSDGRSEEHTSELQSHSDLVCRLLLEKK